MSYRDLAAALAARGARDEAVGVWRERKVLGVPRPPVIDPAGRAWRLGALLLDVEGNLYAVGRVTRAVEPRDFNSDKTVAGEARREEQRAAARGAFVRGETVNFDIRALEPDAPEAPLALVDGELMVLDGTVRMPLDRYLRDRADLLPGA
jgi:hypothetical protein